MRIFCLLRLLYQLSVINSVQAQEYFDCPTAEQLDAENGYPAVWQQDSTTVLVNWTNLWPSLEWPSDCVDELAIVINEEEEIIIDFQDMDGASTLVKVEPCIQLDIVVRLKLNNSQEIDSYFDR